MNTTDYYHAKWRNQTFRLILTLAGLAHAIIWSVVAGFYGKPTLAIFLVCAAAFLTFLASIKFRDCDEAHTRYLRSIINP